ncbi:MAG: nitroreductase family protein [Actinomycetota bacterium]
MTPDELETLIVARRSNLLIDASREVDSVIVDRIVNAAQWAPNHKRTWPLRVAVISGDSRRLLGDTIADAMAVHGDDEMKVAKTRGKFMRSPIIIVVAAAEGATTNETEENKYAVAAGVQNMLLMAESFGLAALWGSPAKGANDAITALCSMDHTDHVMGIVYLGWPTQTIAAPQRPEIDVTHLT